MPRAALATLLGVVVLLGAAPEALAEIYRWTDAEGHVHFTQQLSDVPPALRAEAEAAARDAARQPSPVQTYAAPPRPAPAPSRRRVHQIPFESQGTAMLVQVRVNDRVTAPFLVDTGATDVAIPGWVAREAGVWIGPDTPRATYRTANGIVQKPVVTLDSVQAGDARLEGVRASVSDAMEVGLLGGSFFNNFTFQIDPAAGLISLLPNDRMRSGISETQWRQRFRGLRDRMARLDRYLTENHFAREERVAELEAHRTGMLEALDQLEAEADAADVPRAWRE